MSKQTLQERGQALEAAFFAREHERLVERLRQEKMRAASREELSQISGISDAELLDRLIELDIGADHWSVISLVPMIEVAWADGKVQDKEREALLQAARENGVEPESASHELLDSWLRNRPDARILQAWGEYIVTLCAELSEDRRRALKSAVMDRCRHVAESAGGILGLRKISSEEEVILAELEKAFERTA